MGLTKSFIRCIHNPLQGPILANEIPVVEMALNPGNWEVFWNATFDTVGTDPINPQNATRDEKITTRPSAKATFHVVGKLFLKDTAPKCSMHYVVEISP